LICGLSDRILFRLFESVARPGRYLDHEMNLRRSGGDCLKFLLAFPDLYEIGMSNLGLRVLYHVIGRRPDYQVDVAFAPWADMEAFMRKERLALYGLGTGTNAGEFDVIGFSLQHELQYTNVLNMLDLAGLPLLARDRRDGDPVVVAGGPCAFNPEPMSAFIDGFAIGDGETLAVDLADAIARAKAAGVGRREKLERLAEVPGCYVPTVHGPERRRVVRRVEPVLRDQDFPLPPIVPIIPITHDRLTLEVMRGCTRGCRFCSAGMLTRPVRERPVDSVVALAEAGIAASGWEEVSLVSLSTSDYKELESLVAKLARALGDRQVSISLPSMRPGTFSPEIARVISETRKTGLTFAPEAGTDGLRRSVNKNIDERDLYSTIETAFRGGWDSVKLYFMLGLPGETDTDLDGLIKMAKSVGSVCRVFGKRRHATVSLSPFVPRPLTPLQWEAQVPPEEILRRVNYIRKNLPDDRIRLKWRDPYMSLVEGLLARGDARVAGAILDAWKAGARFDGWTDRFDFALWVKSFEAQGIAVGEAIAPREIGGALPWDRVDGGVSTSFLRDEARKNTTGELTPDCRDGVCSNCGACPGPDRGPSEGPELPASPGARWTAPGPNGKPFQAVMRVRVRYAKADELRFTSHLDVTRAIQRALRRARVPVCYSQGYSHHPRISFGPPLPLGVVGEAEYFDLSVCGRLDEGWLERLNLGFPSGLRAYEARIVSQQGPSLVALLDAAEYRVIVWDSGADSGLALVDGLRHAFGDTGIIRMSHASDGDESRIDLVARLKLDSGAPEKKIGRVLGEAAKPFRIIRKGLYLEKEGTLYSPYGEAVRG
jgi:radical SAM family uncharacterized protein